MLNLYKICCRLTKTPWITTNCRKVSKSLAKSEEISPSLRNLLARKLVNRERFTTKELVNLCIKLLCLSS